MGMTLFGWDFDTWRRAFAWAGVDGNTAFNEVTSNGGLLSGPCVDKHLSVRRKWLEAGGPFNGPVSGLVL